MNRSLWFARLLLAALSVVVLAAARRLHPSADYRELRVAKALLVVAPPVFVATLACAQRARASTKNRVWLPVALLASSVGWVFIVLAGGECTRDFLAVSEGICPGTADIAHGFFGPQLLFWAGALLPAAIALLAVFPPMEPAGPFPVRKGLWLAAGLALGSVALFYGYLAVQRWRRNPPVLVVRHDASPILPRADETPPPVFVEREQRITVAAIERTFLEVVPVQPSASLSLVVVLHGDGADDIHHGWKFEEASKRDAIVIYPFGIDKTWGVARTAAERDVAFVKSAIADVRARYGIAEDRVFATGYSKGAFVASTFACRNPGLFRAIAINAGGAPYEEAQTITDTTGAYAHCDGEVPVPTIVFHGVRDLTVPLKSGRFAARYWAHENGCSLQEGETTDYEPCIASRGCPHGNDVVYCEIEHLGHWVWSENSAATWSFFARHGAEPAGR